MNNDMAQQMRERVREMEREVTRAIFAESKRERWDRMCRDAGRVTFGNILATPDELEGLRAVIRQTNDDIYRAVGIPTRLL